MPAARFANLFPELAELGRPSLQKAGFRERLVDADYYTGENVRCLLLAQLYAARDWDPRVLVTLRDTLERQHLLTATAPCSLWQAAVKRERPEAQASMVAFWDLVASPTALIRELATRQPTTLRRRLTSAQRRPLAIAVHRFMPEVLLITDAFWPIELGEVLSSAVFLSRNYGSHVTNPALNPDAVNPFLLPTEDLMAPSLSEWQTTFLLRALFSSMLGINKRYGMRVDTLRVVFVERGEIAPPADGGAGSPGWYDPSRDLVFVRRPAGEQIGFAGNVSEVIPGILAHELHHALFTGDPSEATPFVAEGVAMRIGEDWQQEWQWFDSRFRMPPLPDTPEGVLETEISARSVQQEFLAAQVAASTIGYLGRESMRLTPWQERFLCVLSNEPPKPTEISALAAMTFREFDNLDLVERRRAYALAWGVAEFERRNRRGEWARLENVGKPRRSLAVQADSVEVLCRDISVWATKLVGSRGVRCHG